MPLLPALVSYAVVLAIEVGPTFTLPWWTNTEEFPYAQEVVRFSSGDFHQRFFDIPGTPLMFGAAAVFALPRWLMSFGAHPAGFALFSRQMTVLLELMRGIEILAFLLAGWLIYLTARRLVSRWAAGLAAVLLATSPVLYTTVSYTRIEALGVLLVTVALYIWVRALPGRSPLPFAGAGLVAGVAMAARFPLGLAALPMFATQAIVFPTKLGRSRLMSVLQGMCVLYGAVALAGAALAVSMREGIISQSGWTDAFFLSAGATPYPNAFSAIRTLWMLAGLAVIVAAAVFATPWTRSWAVRRAQSGLMPLLGAFPLGLVLGTPTIFGGANYFLASVNLFLDRNQTYPVKWTALQTFSLDLFGDRGFRNTFSLVPSGAEPGALFSPLLLALFAIGVVACFRRRSRLLPFVALAIPVGLVSQLGKIEGSRHIAGWLPWFALVIAIGFDFIVGAFARHRRAALEPALVVVVTAILLVPVSSFAGPINTHSIDKTPAMRRLDGWLSANTRPTDLVLHACCTTADAAVIVNWMRENGVRVPPAPRSEIWFGDRTSIDNAVRGYIVIERYEYRGAYLDYYASTDPSERVDPYTNKSFQLVAQFPFGSEWDIEVFRFDIYRSERLASGGIHVVDATYAPECRLAASCGPSGLPRAQAGNWTGEVGAVCDQRRSCRYVVSVGASGDPAPGLAKAFNVTWTCASGRNRTKVLRPEALGRSAILSCP